MAESGCRRACELRQLVHCPAGAVAFYLVSALKGWSGERREKPR